MKKILFIGLLFVLAGPGVWSQEVSDSVRIHYRRGYRGVDPDYHNNRSELERFIRTLRREQESDRLERVVICSWTSPDGVTRYNELLAGRRADSLKSWLVRHAQIPGELVSVRGEGIGWGVLRQLVAVSDMLYKDEVLHILDNTPVWIRDSHGKIVDGRKKQLMDLRGGQPYNYMMENIFPEVRSSLSTICYRKSAPSIDKVTTGTAPTDSALAEKGRDRDSRVSQHSGADICRTGSGHSGGDLPGNLAEGFREIAGSTRPKPGDQDQSALRCPAHAIAGGGIPLQ